jgi:flagellar biosynthetic protein FlhB
MAMLLDTPNSEQERTESATPKRREEARTEGRIPRSQELSGAVLLLAGACGLAYAAGNHMGRQSSSFLAADLQWLAGDVLTPNGAAGLLRLAARHLLLALMPFALVVVGFSLLVGAVQGRGIIALKPLEPKLSHVNPLNGVGRLLSAQTPFNLVKSLAKFAVLGTVAWLALRQAWPRVIALPDATPDQVIVVFRHLAFGLALSVGLAFLALALADYAFEVYRHEKSLRMTRQEVIREHKESEGDPLVKSRIRALQRATSRKRMLRDVAKADVVVTNPTHIAVALKYDAEAAAAPLVLAMGERKLAERIKALAASAGVPMVENRPLAHALLATAKVGQQIPASLYAAVAEVLAYVYRRRAGRGE